MVLVDPIDDLPSTTGNACQNNFNILQGISKFRLKSSFENLPGIEGTLYLCSPDQGTRRQDGDCEWKLSFITWIGELSIVDGPEHNVELNQLPFTK